MNLGYALRRLGVSLALLWLLTVIVFWLGHSIPADPAFFLVTPGHATPQQIARARHELGVDQPIVVQYLRYLWHALDGDLGVSWAIQGTSTGAGTSGNAHVGATVIRAAAVTGSVIAGGAIILTLLAVPLAALSASHPRTPLDRAILAFAIFGIATHPVVVGALLQKYLAGPGHGLPRYGYCNLLGGRGCGGPFDWATHLLLAWFSFALLFLALYVRVLRARLVEVLSEAYITVARAKGASEARILTHHALRNAIAPVMTMLGMDIGVAVGVTIYLEKVYSLPGLGTLLAGALGGQVGYDLPIILGVAIVVGVAIIVLNLFVDLLYPVVDPTLRKSETAGSPSVA